MIGHCQKNLLMGSSTVVMVTQSTQELLWQWYGFFCRVTHVVRPQLDDGSLVLYLFSWMK